jgi:hypothetical protein
MAAGKRGRGREPGVEGFIFVECGLRGMTQSGGNIRASRWHEMRSSARGAIGAMRENRASVLGCISCKAHRYYRVLRAAPASLGEARGGKA